MKGFLDGRGKDDLIYISSDSSVEAETLAEHPLIEADKVTLVF